MKHIKRVMVTMVLVCMFGVYAQDAAGDYQLNGTNVRYTSLYRGSDPGYVMINDTYGMGIAFPALSFNTGDAMNQLVNGPYPRNVLAAIGVNLNVSLYDDGSGYIYEGSTYPTAVTVDCVTFPSVLPVTDQLGYTSNLDVSTSGVSAQTMSILGQASLGPYAGQPIGSFGLQASDVFDFFPATPADAGMGAGLYGPAAGYMMQPHTTPFLPQFNNGDWITDPSQLVPTGGYEEPGDLYLEWHAVDGAISLSGFGDCLPGDPSCGPADGDEDGDGSPLDRQLGVPYLPVSMPNNACGGGAFDPFDFTTLSPDMPVLGGNQSLIDAVAGGGVGLCYGYGGLATFAGMICMGAITTDADGSGVPDMNEGCDAMVASGFYTDGEAATTVTLAACNGLGVFTEAQCDVVAANVEAEAQAGAVAQCSATCDGAGGLVNLLMGSCCAQATGSPDCLGDAGTIAYCSGYAEENSAPFGGSCGAFCDYSYGDSWGCDLVDAITTPDATGLAPVCGGLIDLATSCYADADDDGIPDAPVDCADGEVCACDIGFGNCETFGAKYGAGWGEDCLEGEGTGNSFYVINPAFADYGMYVTANGVQMSGCLQGGNPPEVCASMFGSDDSDHDFNGADGRLVMGYTPQCFAEIQVREVYVDFTELGEGECYADNPYTPGIDEGLGSGTGDIDNSCAGGGTDTDQSCLPNVADVVLMVQVILGNNTLTDQETCRGDINGDGIINVVDVVQTVAIILGGNKADFAEEIDIIKSTNGLRIISEAPVGAVQITLNHGEDFNINLTEDAMVAEYATKGNQTTIIVVMPESDGLFTAEGQYEIVEVIAANDENLISVNVIEPSDFSLSKAYPNPFNPTTSMLLNMEFDGQVEVKVYNVNGQIVDVIADRQFKAGMHTVSWNAQEFASGMYFIKAYIGSEVITQKVSLMK